MEVGDRLPFSVIRYPLAERISRRAELARILSVWIRGTTGSPSTGSFFWGFEQSTQSLELGIDWMSCESAKESLK